MLMIYYLLFYKLFHCLLTDTFCVLSLGTAVSVMAKIPLLECLTRHSYRECLGRLDSLPEHDDSEKAEMKRSTELVLSADRPNKSSLTSFHKSVEHVSSDTTDAESGKEIKESCQSTIQQEETSTDARDSDLPYFNVSLLDWINVQDRPNDVESLVRKCFDSMSRVSSRNLFSLCYLIFQCLLQCILLQFYTMSGTMLGSK